MMKYLGLIILIITVLLVGCEDMHVCGDGVCAEGEECPEDCETAEEEIVEEAPAAEETEVAEEEEIVEEDEEEEPEEIVEEEEFVITAETANYDLSDYPSMFSSNTVIVVGKEGSASDVVSATHIQNSLGGKAKSVLDYEISDVSAQNIISIGNACSNTITAEIIGNPKNCMAGLEEGVGRAALYKNGDKLALIIDGYSSVDIRRVAKRLEENPGGFKGFRSCVYGSGLDVEKIIVC